MLALLIESPLKLDLADECHTPWKTCSHLLADGTFIAKRSGNCRFMGLIHNAFAPQRIVHEKSTIGRLHFWEQHPDLRAVANAAEDLDRTAAAVDDASDGRHAQPGFIKLCCE